MAHGVAQRTRWCARALSGRVELYARSACPARVRARADPTSLIRHHTPHLNPNTTPPTPARKLRTVHFIVLAFLSSLNSSRLQSSPIHPFYWPNDQGAASNTSSVSENQPNIVTGKLINLPTLSIENQSYITHLYYFFIKQLG